MGQLWFELNHIRRNKACCFWILFNAVTNPIFFSGKSGGWKVPLYIQLSQSILINVCACFPLLFLLQSSTCWRWMDRRECCKQREHGGARAGSQRDNADQPGWHGHCWLPHSLIDEASSKLPRTQPMTVCWGEGAPQPRSVFGHTHIHTQVILLVGWYTIISTLLAHNLIHCPTLQVWRKHDPPQNSQTLLKQLSPMHRAFLAPFLLFGVFL